LPIRWDEKAIKKKDSDATILCNPTQGAGLIWWKGGKSLMSKVTSAVHGQKKRGSTSKPSLPIRGALTSIRLKNDDPKSP